MAESLQLLCEVCGVREATHRRGCGFDNRFVCGQCIPADAERDDGGKGPLPEPPEFSGRPEFVYVAGPLTSSGTVWGNVRRALLIADALLFKGHVPFVPHLNATWAQSTAAGEARPETEWLQYDFAVLSRCDSLYRIPGKSRGADLEVGLARVLGLRIYRALEEVPDVPADARAASVPKVEL